MPQALSLISLSNTLTIKEQSQYFIQFTQISLSLLFNTSQPHQFCSQCRNLLIPLDHLSCWWHPLFVVTAIWLLHLCWRWRRYDVDLIDSSAAVATTKMKRRQFDCYICVDDDNTMCLLHLRWRQRWYDDDLIVASVVVTTTIRQYDVLVNCCISGDDDDNAMMFDCCISGDDDNTTIWCACCRCGDDDDGTTMIWLLH